MGETQKQTEHILVVDDDARIRQMLSRYFEGEGIRVTAVGTGAEARDRLAKTPFDAVLLDLMLPNGESGLTIAREIRATSDLPILMLTGRDDVVDRIVGLEIGADDYIAKPFHLREVLARLRTVLRRRQPAGATVRQEGDATLGFDGWRLDLARRELRDPRGISIELTTGEFDMLAVFARHPGRVLDRNTLMDLTRGRNLEAFDRTIDAQISRLRKKLRRDPDAPELIKAVRGIGYVLAGKTDQSG